MKSKDEIITQKLLGEINDIHNFVEGMSEQQFYMDIKTQKAVVMSIINIGELSKSYSASFLSEHAEIPWRQIQAMRNIAAHKYETMNPARIWDTIFVSLPVLEKSIREPS